MFSPLVWCIMAVYQKKKEEKKIVVMIICEDNRSYQALF